MHIEIRLRPESYGQPSTPAILTDEHPASSYGQPVIVRPDGSVLGPGDYAYTFAGENDLIERWNDLVMVLLDQMFPPGLRPDSDEIDVSWLDEE